LRWNGGNGAIRIEIEIDDGISDVTKYESCYEKYEKGEKYLRCWVGISVSATKKVLSSTSKLTCTTDPLTPDHTLKVVVVFASRTLPVVSLLQWILHPPGSQASFMDIFLSAFAETWSD